MSGEKVKPSPAVVTGSHPAPDNVTPLPSSNGDTPEKGADKSKGGTTGPFSLDLLSFKDLENIPDLEWHIDGFVPKGGLTMIYGPPKSGKSFVVMSLILALDHGERWLGHPVVDRCRSLYVALEGRSGLKMRSESWHEHFGHDVEAGGSLIQTGRINLAEHEHRDAIIAAVIENDIQLVAIDTLAKATPGLDENSAKDMGLVIDSAMRIQQETGATVILVHHTGHGDTHRGRGHSSLPGAVDSSIMVKAGRVTGELLKDGGSPLPIDFKLEPVGQSVVAVPRSSSSPDEDPDPEGTREDLEKLRKALEDEGQPLSKNALYRRVGGNRSRITGSIDLWVLRGYLTKTTKDQTQFIGLPGQSVDE